MFIDVKGETFNYKDRFSSYSMLIKWKRGLNKTVGAIYCLIYSIASMDSRAGGCSGVWRFKLDGDTWEDGTKV